jgi:hypothetical protein
MARGRVSWGEFEAAAQIKEQGGREPAGGEAQPAKAGLDPIPPLPGGDR